MLEEKLKKLVEQKLTADSELLGWTEIRNQKLDECDRQIGHWTLHRNIAEIKIQLLRELIEDEKNSESSNADDADCDISADGK